ncbi:MAG: hypothetical protein O2913_12435 [Chloroflexi bacterium]|nr:hypothetical protein [Chloroflexota bacterium]
MPKRWLIILAGLFLPLAAACTSGELVTVLPPVSDGILAGSVTVGPLCPVEPCSREIGDIYSSRELQLQSESASGILVPLQPDGAFRASVPAGEYVVSLSNCDFLGCSASLPVTVVIKDGETSDLHIDIDTGIRGVARSETAHTRLIGDLRAAGAEVESRLGADSSTDFGVPLNVLTVNGSEVYVYEFPNIDDAEAAIGKVGPDGSAIVGIGFVDWTSTPHYYHRDSLIVLFVGRDLDIQETLEGVLGGQFAGGFRAPYRNPEVSEEADSTARRELSARLGVAPGDLRLVRAQATEHSNGALGCPDAGVFYTEAIIPGYVLAYGLNELRYPFHVSADGLLFTDCRRENNVAVPYSHVGGGYLVHENDTFPMAGETLSHLGDETVLLTVSDAEEYLSEVGDAVQISLDRIDWDTEMLVGTTITGSGCEADIWVPLVTMNHQSKSVTVYVAATQTGRCEKEWAHPIWLKVLEVPKDYTASFLLSYRIE